MDFVEIKKLERLLNNMYLCTGIKFALLDESAKEIYTATFQTAFCHAIAQAPGGYEKCVACDGEALKKAQASGKICVYRCHAGLIEVAVPVTENGRTVATILFGQLLDTSSRTEQWEETQRLCQWHPDIAGLHRAFLRIRAVTRQEITACTEIVHACVSEARLADILATAEQDDAQKIQSYIGAHYAENLSLDTLSQALGMGKTKLCALARERLGGTPCALIAQKRAEAAKELLEGTDHSVQAIAEAVGIGDLNYFAKVFRRQVGLTPTAYRRETRREPSAQDSGAETP